MSDTALHPVRLGYTSPAPAAVLLLPLRAPMQLVNAGLLAEVKRSFDIVVKPQEYARSFRVSAAIKEHAQQVPCVLSCCNEFCSSSDWHNLSCSAVVGGQARSFC